MQLLKAGFSSETPYQGWCVGVRDTGITSALLTAQITAQPGEVGSCCYHTYTSICLGKTLKSLFFRKYSPQVKLTTRASDGRKEGKSDSFFAIL
jgi:hypothetical protein